MHTYLKSSLCFRYDYTNNIELLQILIILEPVYEFIITSDVSTFVKGVKKVPSMTKSALLVNKSPLSVQKKCPFSPLLSALLKTAPLPFGPSGAAANDQRVVVAR